MSDNITADENQILIAEFEYITQTAHQAHEDRAKVTTFYFLTVGSLVAGLLGTQLEKVSTPQFFIAFAILFVILSITGLITLLQLIRLRQAWYDSVKAMNQIKQYYLSQHTHTLKSAFLWNVESIPKKNKVWTISFLSAVEVALLGSIVLSAAVIFFGLALQKELWEIAGSMCILYFLLQLWIYYRCLGD